MSSLLCRHARLYTKALLARSAKSSVDVVKATGKKRSVGIHGMRTVAELIVRKRMTGGSEQERNRFFRLLSHALRGGWFPRRKRRRCPVHSPVFAEERKVGRKVVHCDPKRPVFLERPLLKPPSDRLIPEEKKYCVIFGYIALADPQHAPSEKVLAAFTGEQGFDGVELIGAGHILCLCISRGERQGGRDQQT